MERLMQFNNVKEASKLLDYISKNANEKVSKFLREYPIYFEEDYDLGDSTGNFSRMYESLIKTRKTIDEKEFLRQAEFQAVLLDTSELIPLIKLNGYVRNILINYGIELEKVKLMTPLERLIQYAY